MYVCMHVLYVGMCVCVYVVWQRLALFAFLQRIRRTLPMARKAHARLRVPAQRLWGCRTRAAARRDTHIHIHVRMYVCAYVCMYAM